MGNPVKVMLNENEEDKNDNKDENEAIAKNIFKQLIETIKYWHSIGIVHRDVKPDNILLELDSTIKLCDFGVSKEVKEGQLLTDSCGTDRDRKSVV